MKSPFPGMDPYLERSWGDVHLSLTVSASTSLNVSLPEDLVARIDEEELPPDPKDRSFSRIDSAFSDEPETGRFIEIFPHNDKARLVTVIEFLCMAKTNARGRAAFIERRNALVADGVSFVEIDLLREGGTGRILGGVASTYRAIVHVPGEPPKVSLYPISLHEPLPVIAIPLRLMDPVCALPLQPLIEKAYESGRYDRTINYRLPCEPPLDAEDAAWADELLRSTGRR